MHSLVACKYSMYFLSLPLFFPSLPPSPSPPPPPSPPPHTQFKIEVLTTLPIQVDGEAWPQPPGTITIKKLPDQVLEELKTSVVLAKLIGSLATRCPIRVYGTALVSVAPQAHLHV